MAKERIGIVGPGRMGLAMVKHLVKHGYPVTAIDVNKEQLQKAKDAGTDTADSAAELGKTCKFVIIAVGFDAEMWDVTTGKNGLFETLAPGSIVAVSSTVAPNSVQELDVIAQKQGIDIFDAPICGGRFAADDGTLLSLVGGKEEVVARATPIYSTFCGTIKPLGKVGFGQFGKAMNNFLLWINAIGLIEAGRLAEGIGIELPTLFDALKVSTGASQAMHDWDMISFTWALDDMELVSQMSDQYGLSLPIMGAIKELVKDARRIKATNPPDWTGNFKKQGALK